MMDDKGYDRDNQKIVGWSWVRKQVFLTTLVSRAPGRQSFYV